jgi:hypothetical protein
MAFVMSRHKNLHLDLVSFSILSLNVGRHRLGADVEGSIVVAFPAHLFAIHVVHASEDAALC